MDAAVFSDDNLTLLKYAHSVAFSMVLWGQKLFDAPQWAISYFLQLKTDAIQLFPAAIFGNRRTLHLYERAGIEDLFRYAYFYDHRIEHMFLQTQSKSFQKLDFLIDWLKNYPSLQCFKQNVSESCAELLTMYSELSRTIHGTTLSIANLVDSLKTLQKPIAQPLKEMNIMKTVFRNMVFLLTIFHLEKYNNFSIDEKMIICQHLNTKEKKILSGLNT